MRDIIAKLLVQKFYDRPIIVLGEDRSGTSTVFQAPGKHPLMMSTHGEAPSLTTLGGSAYLFKQSNCKKYYLDTLEISKEYLFGRLKQVGFEILPGPYYGLRRMLKWLTRHNTSPLGKRFWAAKPFPSEIITQGLIKVYPGVKNKEFGVQCKEWVQKVNKHDYLTQLDCAIYVKQEDLLRYPRKFFGNITNFLNIPGHADLTDYASKTLVHPLVQNNQQNISVKEIISSCPLTQTDWTDEQK